MVIVPLTERNDYSKFFTICWSNHRLLKSYDELKIFNYDRQINEQSKILCVCIDVKTVGIIFPQVRLLLQVQFDLNFIPKF